MSGIPNKEKKVIAVIGDGSISRDCEEYKAAYELGKALVDAGYKVQTGGLGGVMEAALKGAKDSSKYEKDDTIAILPSKDESEANDYADVLVPTGLDVLRGGRVVDAAAVISIGGGAGTLSEIALAWQSMKLIISYSNYGGWSEKLAGSPLDHKNRYPEVEKDILYPTRNAEETIALLTKYVDIYTKVPQKIHWTTKR